MHTNQWRNRRNQLNLSPIPAFNMYSIANYSTDQSKTDLSKTFAEEMLIHNLHMIPNPLQKNLADTIPTAEPPKVSKQVFTEPKMEKETPRSEYSFSIGSFFSGVISAITSGVFRRRESSQQYYDCFDPDPSWQGANEADLNKSTRSQSVGDVDAMSADCRSAAAHCENKLNRVRHLLTSKPVPTTPKYRRKPKRVFVEPGSVEESFEDAFSPEDFVRLSNSDHIECVSPVNNQNTDMMDAAAVKVKTEVKEVMDIVKTVPETQIAPIQTQNNVNAQPKAESKYNKLELNQVKTEIPSIESKATTEKHIEAKTEAKHDLPVVSTVESKDEKQEIISACEEKVNRLKALLQCRKPKSRLMKSTVSDSVIEPVAEHGHTLRTVQDKHFKNPSRTTDKRKKSQLIKNIQEDMCFGNSLDTEEVSSPDSSPIIRPKLCDMITVKEPILIPEPEPEYFDEVHGRFRSTSTDSEDSFQIVFTDSPKAARHPTLSDCDSEDSFIVFEDSPDSCYTSHDVFGDSTADSDLESEVSDSGCGGSCKLSHSLTRTVGDLTDDSLFDETVREESEDEVDSVTVCEELPDFVEEVRNTGLLLTDAKKLLKRQEPPKKVSFSEKPPTIRVMRVWAFAARQARRGNWEQGAVDRDRFKRKIADVDMAVSWVLKPQHRRRIMFQRFMPWWNKQRRLEIEEKKKKAEEEKKKEEERKLEEERLKAEEKDTEGEENDVEVSGESVKEEVKTEGDEESGNIVVNGIRDVNIVCSAKETAKNSNYSGMCNEMDKNSVVNTAETKSLNIVVGKDDNKTGISNEVKVKTKDKNVNGKINDFKSIDDIVVGVKTLAKSDFYDKSDKILNKSSKANSIDLTTKVKVI